MIEWALNIISNALGRKTFSSLKNSEQKEREHVAYQRLYTLLLACTVVIVKLVVQLESAESATINVHWFITFRIENSFEKW